MEQGIDRAEHNHASFRQGGAAAFDGEARAVKWLFDSLRASLVPILPNAVVSRVRKLRRRPLFESCRQVGVYFTHIPRSAGTSVAMALYGESINHFPIAEMLPLLPADVLNLPRFTITRNPWDRAVSAWSFAMAGGGRDGLVKVRNGGTYQFQRFENFEHFVNDWLAPRNPSRLDPIFRPQTDFLLDEAGAMPFDHIGKFEELAATEVWLRATLPRTRNLAHLNASERIDYRKYYTPQLRDLVARIYARDVELLGYDF